jgi:hypothetical protein
MLVTTHLAETIIEGCCPRSFSLNMNFDKIMNLCALKKFLAQILHATSIFKTIKGIDLNLIHLFKTIKRGPSPSSIILTLILTVPSGLTALCEFSKFLV